MDYTTIYVRTHMTSFGNNTCTCQTPSSAAWGAHLVNFDNVGSATGLLPKRLTPKGSTHTQYLKFLLQELVEGTILEAGDFKHWLHEL